MSIIFIRETIRSRVTRVDKDVCCVGDKEGHFMDERKASIFSLHGRDMVGL